MNNMNIVLIGLRGSGKTEIAKILSKKLEWNFIDIDEEIENSQNMKISEIIEKHGWEYFRKKETEATTKASESEKTIISTGGGVVTNQKNINALKKTGKIIYLKRTPEDCIKWIKDDPNRPSLTGNKDQLEDLKKIYEDRKDLYENAADITFERSDDLEKDSDEIIIAIRMRV